LTRRDHTLALYETLKADATFSNVKEEGLKFDQKLIYQTFINEA